PDGDAQPFGDRFIRVTVTDMRQHIELAFGQSKVITSSNLRVVSRGSFGHGGQQATTDFRGDAALPGGDTLDRADDVGGFSGFQQESCSAGTNRAENVVVVVVGGQYQHVDT